ncbi:MAG: glycosyltransferase family 39 protein [Thermoleophilaceae bacterium]|nr:glycosyltransferase family 39 protein [Thermoleophilaceae bacterium]
MSLADHLLGMVLFAGTTGSALIAGVLLMRRRLAHLSGAEAVVAAAMLGIALVTAVHMLPGLLGVLSQVSALVCGLAVLAAVALFVKPAPAAIQPSRAPVPPSGRASWAIAAIGAGAASVWALSAAWAGTVIPSTGLDTLTHHLPNVGKWVQDGTMWRVDQFVPLLANGNYPQGGDVVTLAALLPWENDAFVRLVDFPLVALAAVAIYAAAVEIGAPRATAVLFAALLASMPVVVDPAYQGTMTDPLFMAGFGAGILFLLRAWRTRAGSDLLLAGISLGLGFGSKWYGITAALAVIVIYAGACLLTRRPFVRPALIVGFATLGVGGFWLVRNWVESSNPFNPVPVKVGGLTIFDAPRDFVRECAGFTISDYLTDGAVLRDYVWPAYREFFALPGLVLALGVLAAVVLALRRPRSGPVLALALLTFVLAAIYTVTPYTALGLEGMPIAIDANTRYLLPAFVSAAMVAPWLVGRLGRGRVVGEAVALVALADGIRRGFDLERSLVVKVGLLVVLALALVWLVRSYVLPRLGVRTRRAALAGAVVIGLVAVTAVGHVRQRDFNDARYFDMEAPVAYIAKNAQEGQRVGLAGIWGVRALGPAWPSFGLRLGNEVEFIGPTVDGQLREYPTKAEFDRAVRAGVYDLVLAGSGGAAPSCPYPAGPHDRARAWARELGYEPVVESEFLTLYRAPG